MTNIISDIEGIVNVGDAVIGELVKVLGSINVSDIESFFSVVNQGAGSASSYGTHFLKQGIAAFDKDIGRLIVQPLIEGTMGVNYSQLQADSADAVNTLEGAVGFSLVLDGVTSGLDAILKPIFGDRAPEFILDSIRKIPQSVGMEYFLGITLANTFEKAVGTPLEEAINIQVLPSRLDLNTIKAALKQHKITDAEADTYRQKLGFPQADWNTFLELGNSVLPIGDLQSAYEYGFMSEAEITAYLQTQGFTDSDITLMVQIYLHNSETSGGQIYRQVARTAFLQDAISTTQFTDILTTAGVPKNSITMELAALNLQKSIGLKQLSAGDIKTAFENGDLTQAEVTSKLLDEGYSTSDVDLILKEWGITEVLSKPNVTAKTVLRYLRSGVINPSQATLALTNLGIRPIDIDAMLANPTMLGGGYTHTYNQNTVLSAVKDGILDVDSARTILEELGVQPDYVTTLLQIAIYQGVNRKKTKSVNKALDIGQIEKAVKYGTATEPWAITQLQNIGYSNNDAQLIAATFYAELTGAPPAGWTPYV